MKSVFFLAFLVSVSLAANIERDEPIYEGYSINNDGGNDLATLIANSNNFLDILNNLIDQNGLLDNPGGDATGAFCVVEHQCASGQCSNNACT